MSISYVLIADIKLTTNLFFTLHKDILTKKKVIYCQIDTQTAQKSNILSIYLKECIKSPLLFLSCYFKSELYTEERR